VTGRVLAPNGVTPIPGAIVYVPTAGVPALPSGAACGCGAPPVVAATKTAADGTFTLSGLPVGEGVPLVMQLGKWRRAISLPKIDACASLTLPEADTRLPKNRAEGDMPTIAVTTGACDALGCLFPKLGVDPSEIGVADDGPMKAIHTYRGAVERDEAPRGASRADALWSDEAALSRYDIVLLACECGEHVARKGPRANQAMARYLDSGGKILTTDLMFTWYRDMPSPGLSRVVEVRGGAHEADNPVRIGTTSAAGATFADFTRAVTPAPAREGHVRFATVFDNLGAVDPTKATVLASSATPRSPGKDGARIFSLDFPVGAARAEACGRAVHLDAHVNDTRTDLVSREFPAACSRGLDESHAALAFLFFHLASCEVPIPSLPSPPPEPIR